MKKARPTKNHRLAIVPGILGTYYAVDERGECRYFDYDREAAFAFGGVTPDRDPRQAPAGPYQYVRRGATEGNPKPGQACIWVLKEKGGAPGGTPPRPEPQS